MIVVIDNFDSFTYNLVQYLQILHDRVVVFRNNGISIRDIADLGPEGIVISPGPCTPDKAGISLGIVETFKESVPILGVCLGHQVIGQVFGATVVHAVRPFHGKVHSINHDGKGIFEGLKKTLAVTRYHSLVLDRHTLPKELEISAETDDGEIMGVRHWRYPAEGVQFHPEAILTEGGMIMIENFLARAQQFKEHRHAL